MLRTALLSLTALAALAACTSGELGETGQMVQRAEATIAVAALGNTLAQSGQGNSGGILAIQGQPPVAGIEATMTYNSRGRVSGARVDLHNGPMTGVGVRCSRAGGGATVPECTAINAQQAFLVNELSGAHSYAGAFAVNGYGTGNAQNGFVAIHSGPGASETIQMPGNSVTYSGRFQAGGSVVEAGRTFSGRASGSAEMTANFASGAMDGTFRGQVVDDTTKLSAGLEAGFSNAVIDPNTRFYNNSATTFNYSGAKAWGELDGAFYGPNAEEAAGTFGFGNSKGGMTGIVIGCSQYNQMNCLHPTPRF